MRLGRWTRSRRPYGSSWGSKRPPSDHVMACPANHEELSPRSREQARPPGGAWRRCCVRSARGMLSLRHKPRVRLPRPARRTPLPLAGSLTPRPPARSGLGERSDEGMPGDHACAALHRPLALSQQMADLLRQRLVADAQTWAVAVLLTWSPEIGPLD